MKFLIFNINIPLRFLFSSRKLSMASTFSFWKNYWIVVCGNFRCSKVWGRKNEPHIIIALLTNDIINNTDDVLYLFSPSFGSQDTYDGIITISIYFIKKYNSYTN